MSNPDRRGSTPERDSESYDPTVPTPYSDKEGVRGIVQHLAKVYLEGAGADDGLNPDIWGDTLNPKNREALVVRVNDRFTDMIQSMDQILASSVVSNNPQLQEQVRELQGLLQTLHTRMQKEFNEVSEELTPAFRLGLAAAELRGTVNAVKQIACVDAASSETGEGEAEPYKFDDDVYRYLEKIRRPFLGYIEAMDQVAGAQ